MPKTKSAKRRARLNLRKTNGEPRYNASMRETPTGQRLRASAEHAGSVSIDAELNRLMDRDAELTRLLATKG